MEKTIEIPEGYEARIEGNKVILEPKESEDERIRKGLIAIITDFEGLYLQENYSLSREEALAWLEKQGEQKLLNNDKYQTVPIEILDRLYKSEKELEELKQGSQNLANSAKTCKVEPKFPSLSEKEIVCLKRILDFLREEHNSYTGKDFTNEIAVLEWLITHPVLIHSSELQPNQGWQNPAWSEEDKEMRIKVLKYLLTRCNVFEYEEVEKWLDVLKERYTWKPSDEQIESLEHFVRCVGESGYMSPYDCSTKIVYSLLDDLKKLKG